MANNWHEITGKPAGKRFTDTAGTVYVVGNGTPNYSDRERPYATVQPGKGVREETNHGVAGGTFKAPAVQPSQYAREFGKEPGPEWIINGRPFASHVRVYAAAEVPEGVVRGYSDDAHVEFPSFNDGLTDAARRAISEWLTSPEMLGELFSPLNVAEATAAEAASALYYAERDEREARAAAKTATEARRAAQLANRRASDSYARLRSADARAVVAASEAAEVTE